MYLSFECSKFHEQDERCMYCVCVCKKYSMVHVCCSRQMDEWSVFVRKVTSQHHGSCQIGTLFSPPPCYVYGEKFYYGKLCTVWRQRRQVTFYAFLTQEKASCLCVPQKHCVLVVAASARDSSSNSGSTERLMCCSDSGGKKSSADVQRIFYHVFKQNWRWLRSLALSVRSDLPFRVCMEKSSE